MIGDDNNICTSGDGLLLELITYSSRLYFKASFKNE